MRYVKTLADISGDIAASPDYSEEVQAVCWHLHIAAVSYLGADLPSVARRFGRALEAALDLPAFADRMTLSDLALFGQAVHQ